MTEKENIKRGKKLGLNSIHEMGNGNLCAGSTHQQYESWINDPLKSVYSKLRTLEPTEFIQGSNQIGLRKRTMRMDSFIDIFK